jgi:hypothetical protein
MCMCNVAVMNAKSRGDNLIAQVLMVSVGLDLKFVDTLLDVALSFILDSYWVFPTAPRD